MSARHFELIKRPGLIVPEAALRRRHICYSGSPPPTCTFTDVSNVLADGNAHTHSGLSFGSAKSDRLLIATLTYNANNITSLSSVTIGGVSATRLVKRLYNQSAGATLTPSSEIWAASVPTGTSGSVVLNVNTSGNLWDSSVAIYAATGLRSATPTAIMSSDDVSHSKTLNMSVSVQGGGFAVATAYFEGLGTATSSTWTGATQSFFDAMNNPSGQVGAQSGALASVTSTQTINTTTKFNGGSLIGIVGCIAAFR